MVFRPEAEAYFIEVLQQQPKDRWERFRCNKLLYQYGDFLGYALLSGDPELQKKIRPLLLLAESNFFRLTGMIEVLMTHQAQPSLPQIESWLKIAKLLQDETLDKERQARFTYLQGLAAFLAISKRLLKLSTSLLGPIPILKMPLSWLYKNSGNKFPSRGIFSASSKKIETH